MSGRPSHHHPGPFGFGYCPTCGGAVVARERRAVGGMSRCLHGHDTPNEAVTPVAGAQRPETPRTKERRP